MVPIEKAHSVKVKREIKMAAPWSPVSVLACQFSAFNCRVRLSSILLPINAWILSSWADKSWKWPFSCKFQCSFFSHVQICCDHLNFLMWFWTWCLVCEPWRRGPKIRIEVHFTKVYGWNRFCPCFWTNPDHFQLIPSWLRPFVANFCRSVGLGVSL